MNHVLANETRCRKNVIAILTKRESLEFAGFPLVGPRTIEPDPVSRNMNNRTGSGEAFLFFFWPSEKVCNLPGWNCDSLILQLCLRFEFARGVAAIENRNSVVQVKKGANEKLKLVLNFDGIIKFNDFHLAPWRTVDWLMLMHYLCDFNRHFFLSS